MQPDSTPSSAGVRAGGTVLSLLAGPLCAPILRAHLDGPLRLPDLREQIGGAAQTTLRGQVGNLRAIGALERHVRTGMPYTVENELTDVGRGILGVAEVVEDWLSWAPQGPIPLGSEPAKGAIRSLVGGWGSTVLRALAARPLSLTELSGVIPDLSYPSLERRLSAMRASRQVEVLHNESGKARPYGVTDWTRQAVGPLVAASRCECRHIGEGTGSARRGSTSRPPSCWPFRWSCCPPTGRAHASSRSIPSMPRSPAQDATGVRVDLRVRRGHILRAPPSSGSRAPGPSARSMPGSMRSATAVSTVSASAGPTRIWLAA